MSVASAILQATPSRSARAARTRERLLDSAGERFAANGFAKTTVEEIAHRAGVSKGLVYHHFRSKDELLRAVLDRTLAEWDAVTARAGLDSAPSVVAALSAMQRDTLRWARRRPVVLAIVRLDPMVLMAVGREAVLSALDTFRTRIVRGLEAGVTSGELRADVDVARLADLLAMLHLAFVEHLLEPEWIDAPDEALVDATFDALVRGIARRDS